MKLNQIRTKFLEYFKTKGHTIVKSSPLVPGNDPTLLFTNAGMVQFKDVFLGTDQRAYSKATSVQRCLRAGGKHNDLENVGYTARHHTFFEMLGNFSFGDYFKEDAIRFAWEFLTKEIKLPPEKLWVTVYEEDQEAEDIWLKIIKVDPTRFSRCGKKDNFWQMGDTGPCGPCTEIFYDHGPDVPGGPPGSPEGDLDRYIEIWNLVFMQYDRDTNGNLTKLPKQSVDTGMGIERLAAVVQGVHSNYEIDLFANLIKAAAELLKVTDLSNQSLKVLADHIRACSFLITDGVIPSNEGRGYVLRRIIRRAIRHGNKLGATDAFFYKLVEDLCTEMGEAYPELEAAKKTIKIVLQQEEEQFARTLDQGIKKLEAAIEGQIQEDKSIKTISSRLVFELYDTYGFPIDLTVDILREKNWTVNLVEVERLLLEQRERSKQSSGFKKAANQDNKLLNLSNTKFTGYDSLSGDIVVTAILDEHYHHVDSINAKANGHGYIVTDSTPFYAEGGGQVGDEGRLSSNNFVAVVSNTIKINKSHLHQINIESGEVKVGDKLFAQVDASKRAATARNHTGTHLLHAALRKILGPQVLQKGSYVGPEYLRFDFAYYQAVSKADLELVEQEVNQQILKNTAADLRLMDIEEAMNSGAMALFGEKYDEKVRVLNLGDGYSVELCGGTHTERSGDIGLFLITSESSAASGIRRIEAITGETARNYLKDRDTKLKQAADLLKTYPAYVVDKIKQLQQDYNKLLKEANSFKQKQEQQNTKSLHSQAFEINDIKILIARLENSDETALRLTLDQLKTELQKAVIILATVEPASQKVKLIAGVTNNCTDRVHAGKLINMIALQLEGKGGGRADMAQAGGKCPDEPDSMAKLDAVLASALPWVKNLINH